MKVLVTSFKPFNNCVNNYSSEVLKYINATDKYILDVVYDKCYEELSNKYDLSKYDLIIAMGEARSRKSITLETRAINLASCSLPDNSNNIRKDEKIIQDGKEYINTNVNINILNNTIELSNDAGKFVCNNLYYHLLYNYPNKSLFIHIPDCNNLDEEYKKNANIVNEIISIYYKHYI